MYVCNITELEEGLNAVNDDVAEMKESMKRKADLKQLEYIEREVENNLVFYNIPEKSEGDTSNCVAFIQRFIASTGAWKHCVDTSKLSVLIVLRSDAIEQKQKESKTDPRSLSKIHG